MEAELFPLAKVPRNLLTLNQNVKGSLCWTKDMA
eukprot:CAMPEP_0169287328 /NCGR_PEP_ID=MMETSP1016-20121227/59835_1 /TAXON_ID=342587 /ORGANISM="Karlodinium micrum, Strain CCMP2283" /LENGTH=33 /DNA_ID= /DNA_START= /DNA_END= /DNA_ORIENTATION=